MGNFKSAFFAYPAGNPELVLPIESAIDQINSGGGNLAVTKWPSLSIFGAFIPDKVRNGIIQSDVFVPDVTKPNPNVYYETGFAIGTGKPIAPVINSSFAGAVQDAQKDGFFDLVGFRQYENSQRLTEVLQDLPSENLMDLYGKSLNVQQPLFFLDSFRKTDFRNAIISAVKASRVFYRGFDPVEIARFSTVPIIGDVTSSTGVIVQFLNPDIDDAARHNLRAAFLAGLAHGLDRQTLMLRMQSTSPEATLPADFRDDVIPVREPAQIEQLVEPFCRSALFAIQSVPTPKKRKSKSDLQEVSLGASAAENEFRTLADYFVETAEFVRTMRGEVGVVSGRKGSGKTAIFFRARDSFRERNAVVTDLKPESHQLSLFRQELLKLVDIGAFDHTLAAFWYFVILSELLLTLKRSHSRRRHTSESFKSLEEIDQLLGRFGIFESGDFTSRLNRLGSEIARKLTALKDKRITPSAEMLTNIVFGSGVAELRTAIVQHTTSKDHIVLLFDNIDKGWPTNGVHEFDVRLVRLLLEALDKVRRDFNAAGRDFKSVVFLRNDIYELLLQLTPDRGKAGEIRIDWTDREKLRQVIFRRLQASMMPAHKESFEQLWSRLFVDRVSGRPSFEYFLDHCLMRPRFLINIIENALANGINRGHEIATDQDCIDAVRQHSLYLMDDFGYEIRDVSGITSDILYAFIGVSHLLTKKEIVAKLTESGISESDCERAFELLLWYGVLGVAARNGQERFIYDYEYNMKRLEAEIVSQGADVLYVTNPAIHVALTS